MTTEGMENDEPLAEGVEQPPEAFPSPEVSTSTSIKNIIEVEGNSGQIILHENFYYGRENSDEDSDKIEFSIFEQSDYVAETPIPDGVIDQLDHTHLLVINHGTHSRSTAMGVLEQVLFNKDLDYYGKPSCCTLQLQSSFAISRFIADFSSSPQFVRGQRQVLVIFEERANDEYDVLWSRLKQRGGVADDITRKLKAQGIMLVYVCHTEHLYNRRENEDTYFALCLAHPIISAFYLALQDYHQAIATYFTAIETYSATGWLVHEPEIERIRQWCELIRDGGFDDEAGRQISSLNETEEIQSIALLLTDPLKAIALFIAAYFEKIDINEFDLLARLLITSLPVHTTSGDLSQTRPDLLWEWEMRTDRILAECGLIIDDLSGKESYSYKFEKEFRKTHLLKQLTTRYRMLLSKRHEVIEVKLLSFYENYSPALLDGWFSLSFENARLNPARYITQFCFTLVDQLVETDENKLTITKKREIFSVLVRFIRQCEDRKEPAINLSGFYERMRERREYRNILAALLGHICTADRPENLNKLKTYLESIGRSELQSAYRLISHLTGHYIDQLDYFFNHLQQWRNIENGMFSKSYIYLKCAFIIGIRNLWLLDVRKNEKLNQLIRQLALGDDRDALLHFIQFTMVNDVSACFNQVYRSFSPDRTLQSILLERKLNESLHELIATMLVQCYTLIKFIYEERPGVEWTPLMAITPCAHALTGAYPIGEMKKGLSNVIGDYNSVLVDRLKKEPTINDSLRGITIKRDLAKELLTLF